METAALVRGQQAQSVRLSSNGLARYGWLLFSVLFLLASLASGRPVKSSVGMTGEVTLQGKVLPIGGVKQKLLAAHRAGLTDVIIPKRNEPDLDDLPESVRGELRIHPVSDVADVLALALEPAPVTVAA